MSLLNKFSYNSLPVLALVLISLATFIYYYLCTKHYRSNGRAKENLPPGSLGLPVIGETFSYVKARREGRADQWIQRRAATDGPVFKTSLMGSPTVVVTGRLGNKFVLNSSDDVLCVRQPATIVRLFGRRNLFELTGSKYKLVKGALMSFLKPECLQEYIGHMDTLVKTQLLTETKDNETISAVLLMKKVAFNLACTLLFGLHDEATKEALREDFTQTFKGMWSLPIKIPGTTYHRALEARARIVKRLLPILESRRNQQSEGRICAKYDLISSLLSLRDENGERITEEEIIDCIVTLLIASHDTTAALLSLVIWKLATDPDIYKKVLEEQMEILNERHEEKHGKLTWTEVQKMKYTWRVAQELLRLIPPGLGMFRKAVKGISFGGYDIPKGWQVLCVASGTHMDNDIFEDPEKFDPSRFENLTRPIPPFAYIPFGGGPHMCIGNEFARVEVLVVIHHLVTRFEWTQLCPDEKITRQPFPYPSKGLPIKMKARGL